MKLPFSRLWGMQRAARRARAQAESAGDAVWLLGGRSLSASQAIQVAAVFRCVDIISKTMAALPLFLYRDGPEGKEKAKSHPLYRLLYVQPNRHTTAYELIQMYVANLLLTRGAFLRIQRDAMGRVAALWNIPTCRVSEVFINPINGERYIYVFTDAGVETLRDGDFVYTPSFLFSDQWVPEDPMRIAAEVLGLADDMAEFAKQGFTQASPGGFIEHPRSLSDEAYERFKRDFNANYQGVVNAGRWLFLEEGAKAQPWDRDMEKTQLLESRKWAISEICRIFGVPAHLCMDMEHSTFSNIEQQSLEFVRDCINPLSVRLEQTFYKDLLTDREKVRYFYKFNTNGLLRGDTATRTQYYSAMRQNGVLNADEIRELEDMNHIPGGAGQIYTVNGNMIPLSSVPKNLPKGAKANG